VTDVFVRRCTVRIVRHGGWGWGPRPRSLVDQVLRALPGLLEAQLESAAAGWSTSTVSVDAPVRVAARVRVAELVDGPSRGVAASLAAPVRLAVHDAVAAASTQASDAAVEDSRPPTSRRPELGVVDERGSSTSGPLAVLHDWAARGALLQLLDLLPLPTLDALLAFGVDAEAVGDGTADAELVETLRQAVAERPSTGGSARMRALLAAVVELHTRGAAPTRELLRAARVLAGPERGDTAAPRPPSARRLPQAAAASPARSAPAQRAQSEPDRTPRHDADAPLPTRVVGRALPFLLLQPLSRLGYLDALGSVLDAERAAAFAAALAWKVLDPPERGWRRTPADELTAAAFAGAAVRVPEERVATLSRSTDAFAPLLAAVVADAIVRGRPAGAELAVVRANGTLLVLDPEGCFAVASAGDAEDLVPALRLAVPRVAYADDTCTRRVLRALGVRTRALRHHPTLDIDRVDKCTAALGRRTGAARAERPELERALALAAWTALGIIAWTLWRERGPTDPLLALDRFGDLEARVDFRPHGLSVTLPLGRRSLDLQEHDLLGAVRDVPWLPSRFVEIGAG
jgi:hypothetical protein